MNEEVDILGNKFIELLSDCFEGFLYLLNLFINSLTPSMVVFGVFIPASYVIYRYSRERVSRVQNVPEVLADLDLKEPQCVYLDLEITDKNVECPICGDLLEGEQLTVCAKCYFPHHAECWEYNGGCTQYLCRGRDGLKEVE